MGMSRRDFVRASAGALGFAYASTAMAPVKLLAEFPMEQQGPPAPPKYYLLHKAFGDPAASTWVVDGFDQMADQIDLELRLLRIPSDRILFVERKSGEVLEEYEHAGTHRQSWAARSMHDPEYARAYTLSVSGKMEDRIAQSAGLKKGEVIGRVGYADVLAGGIARIAPWAGYLERIAECNGIDPLLPIIIALQETNWSPTLTSDAACHGVFQLNEPNATDYGLHMPRNHYDVNESYNPMAQALVAVPFLKSRIPLAGNAVIATSFYHAGENNVLKMMALAVLEDPSFADRPADAFTWVLQHYDNAFNTGGFSGFGYVSSRYPLRVLAMKEAIQGLETRTDQVMRMDMVEAQPGMRAHSVLKEYFKGDKELFTELNPHVPVRNGRIVNSSIPAGVRICLPVGEGTRFKDRHGGALMRFDGTIDPLPGCVPWTDADKAYGNAAEMRASRIDGVSEEEIHRLYVDMCKLEQSHPGPFRRHQRLTLRKDLDLYCEEGRDLYAGVAGGRGLRMTRRQEQKLAEARAPKQKVARKGRKGRRA